MSDALRTEVLHAVLTGAAFLAVFGLAELWRRFGTPPVEWTRKLVHVAGGLIAALFPWLFTSAWTILALGVSFVGILGVTRRFGLLGSVHGVARRSNGWFWFPASICLLYLVAADRPVFYLISVLTLVVADATAALVGSTYGRTTFTAERDRRSIEGSVVFLITTFLLVHLPLLLMMDVDPQLSVLIGAQIALIVAMLEAVSLDGNDNLIVPLATYFLLFKLTAQTPESLQYQIAAQLVMIVLVAILVRRYAYVTLSGALMLMLFLYGAFALGGEEWVIPPAVGLLAFGIFYGSRVPPSSGEAHPRYQTIATFYVLVVPALVYFANNMLETVLRAPAWLASGDPLSPLFLGAIAAQLALITWNLEPGAGGSTLGMPGWAAAQGIAGGRPVGTDAVAHRATARAVILSTVGAAIVVILTGMPLFNLGWHQVAVALATTALGSAIYHALRPARWWPQQPPWNVRLQAVAVALAVLLVLPVLLSMLAR